ARSSSTASSSAARAERRSPTPNGPSKRALTAATWFSSTARTSAHDSPAWMFVQYVRCGAPGKAASFTSPSLPGTTARPSHAELVDRRAHDAVIDLVHLTPGADAGEHRHGELAAEVLAKLLEAVEDAIDLPERVVPHREPERAHDVDRPLGHLGAG